VDTAASRASRQINAYRDTSAKEHISILHAGLANTQNERCSAQAVAAGGGRSGRAWGATLSPPAAPAPAPCTKSLTAPGQLSPLTAANTLLQQSISRPHPSSSPCFIESPIRRWPGWKILQLIHMFNISSFQGYRDLPKEQRHTNRAGTWRKHHPAGLDQDSSSHIRYRLSDGDHSPAYSLLW